jgi:addiction module HigA family antidote
MDYPIHPGAILGEELEARHMSRAELARLMGRPVKAIAEIVAGRRAITAQTALDIERALGVSAQFWVNLQGSYELTLARQKRTAQPA